MALLTKDPTDRLNLPGNLCGDDAGNTATEELGLVIKPNLNYFIFSCFDTVNLPTTSSLAVAILCGNDGAFCMTSQL